MLRSASVRNPPTHAGSEPRKRMATHHFPSFEGSTSERESPFVANPCGPPPSIPLPPTPPPSHSPIPQFAAILELELQKRAAALKQTHSTKPSTSTEDSWRTKQLRHARSRSAAAAFAKATSHIETNDKASPSVLPLVVPDRKRSTKVATRRLNNGSVEDYENAMVMMVNELGLEAQKAANIDSHIDVHLSSMKNKILRNLLSLSPPAEAASEFMQRDSTPKRLFSLPSFDLSQDGVTTWKDELHCALDELVSSTCDHPIKDAKTDPVASFNGVLDRHSSSSPSPSSQLLDSPEVEIRMPADTVLDSGRPMGLSSQTSPPNHTRGQSVTLDTPYDHSSSASDPSATLCDIGTDGSRTTEVSTNVSQESSIQPDALRSIRRENNARSSDRSTALSKRPSIVSAQDSHSQVDLRILSSFERDLSAGNSSGPLTSTPAKRIDQFRRIGLGRPPLSRLAATNFQLKDLSIQSQPPKPKANMRDIVAQSTVVPTASGQDKENRPRSKKLAVRPPRPQVLATAASSLRDRDGEQARPSGLRDTNRPPETDMFSFC